MLFPESEKYSIYQKNFEKGILEALGKWYTIENSYYDQNLIREFKLRDLPP
jgi:hypothetical protein